MSRKTERKERKKLSAAVAPVPQRRSSRIEKRKERSASKDASTKHTKSNINVLPAVEIPLTTSLQRPLNRPIQKEAYKAYTHPGPINEHNVSDVHSTVTNGAPSNDHHWISKAVPTMAPVSYPWKSEASYLKYESEDGASSSQAALAVTRHQNNLKPTLVPTSTLASDSIEVKKNYTHAAMQKKDTTAPPPPTPANTSPQPQPTKAPNIDLILKDTSSIRKALTLSNTPTYIPCIRSLTIHLDTSTHDDFHDDFLTMLLNQFHPTTHTHNPHNLQKITIAVQGPLRFTRQTYTLLTPSTSTSLHSDLHALLTDSGAQHPPSTPPLTVFATEKAFVKALCAIRGVKDVEIQGRLDGELANVVTSSLHSALGRGPRAPRLVGLDRPGQHYSKGYYWERERRWSEGRGVVPVLLRTARQGYVGAEVEEGLGKRKRGYRDEWITAPPRTSKRVRKVVDYAAEDFGEQEREREGGGKERGGEKLGLKLGLKAQKRGLVKVEDLVPVRGVPLGCRMTPTEALGVGVVGWKND